MENKFEDTSYNSHKNKPVHRQFWIIFGIYALICLYFALYRQVPFISDSQIYYDWAKQAYKNGLLFPYHDAIYSPWLAAFVHVNLGVLALHIYDSPTSIYLLSVLLNLTQLFLVYRLTTHLFDVKSGIIAALMYVFYLNSLGFVVFNLTELTFTVFMLASLWFYFKNPTFFNGLLSGLMTGLALGARPLIFALVLVYALIWAWNWFKKQPLHGQFVGILIGLLTYIAVMGSYSKQQTSHFLYSTTTGPLNLLMSSFDGATGVYNDSIIKTDSIYLSKKTFDEKGAYLQERSIKYLKTHPWKWFSILPRKITATFTTDDVTVSYLLNHNHWNLNRFVTEFKAHKTNFEKEPTIFRWSFLSLQVYHHLFYYTFLLLWIYQVYYYWQRRSTTHLAVWVINAFTILGFAMTFISTQGNNRYKYPYLIATMIIVAPIVKRIIFRYSPSK